MSSQPNVLAKLFLPFTVMLAAGCSQELSVDIPTNRVLATYKIDSASEGYIATTAVLRNMDTNTQIALVEGEAITVTSDNVTRQLEKSRLPFSSIYSLDFSSSTQANNEYRFSWSRQGEGANAENTRVKLPQAPSISIVGGGNVFMLDESVSFTWLTDPSIDKVNYYSTAGCNLTRDAQGNFIQAALLDENAGIVYDFSISKILDDTGQLTTNPRELLTTPYAKVDTIKNKLKLADASLVQYCVVNIRLTRKSAGTLDTKYAGGSVIASQERKISLYVNVDSL